MTTLEQRFLAWELFIRSHVLQTKRQVDGVELRAVDDGVEERWVQRYVVEQYPKLGFSKVKGPYSEGPDFQISRKRRWAWAEVETCWQNYRRHGHHLDLAFKNVQYLILLSAETPPADKVRELPPQIINIDHEHFLDWFNVVVSKPQMAGFRIELVAGAMQEHWIKVCCDKGRDMATCPDCDGCAYFGEGVFGEATPFFQNLAVRFITLHPALYSPELSLAKIKSAQLRRFVEKNPPQ